MCLRRVLEIHEQQEDDMWNDILHCVRVRQEVSSRGLFSSSPLASSLSILAAMYSAESNKCTPHPTPDQEFRYSDKQPPADKSQVPVCMSV